VNVSTLTVADPGVSRLHKNIIDEGFELIASNPNDLILLQLHETNLLESHLHLLLQDLKVAILSLAESS
jgi:hypothetical protein